MRLTLLRSAFAVALVAVFVLALLPVPEQLAMHFRWQDKLEHALVFLVLALLAHGARLGRPVLWTAGLVGYGLAIEVAQSLTPHRTGDAWDWLADAAGVGLALLLIRRRRGR